MVVKNEMALVKNEMAFVKNEMAFVVGPPLPLIWAMIGVGDSDGLVEKDFMACNGSELRNPPGTDPLNSPVRSILRKAQPRTVHFTAYISLDSHSR